MTTSALVDGVEFEGGSTDGNGTDLVIGSGDYIDDFENQLDRLPSRGYGRSTGNLPG